LESAGVLLSVEMYPEAKLERDRAAARDTAHLAWPTLRGIELQVLTVRPG
jgi:hypothetical protein